MRAKPEATTICRNVLFFKLRLTFLVFAGTRILFGRSLSKDCAIVVIDILWAQISYLVLGFTLSLGLYLLNGISFPPFRIIFLGFFHAYLQVEIRAHSHKNSHQDLLHWQHNSNRLHKKPPSFQPNTLLPFYNYSPAKMLINIHENYFSN